MDIFTIQDNYVLVKLFAKSGAVYLLNRVRRYVSVSNHLAQFDGQFVRVNYRYI